jgi:uncharacterized membrane protein YqjE
VTVPKHASKPAEPSIGDLVKDVTTNMSTVLHGEIELAKIELKSTFRSVQWGVIYFVAAAVLVMFSLTFLFIGLAELLAWYHIWRWASYLIVFGFFTLISGWLAWRGIKSVKKAKAPERTIATTKGTVAALRDAAHHE